VESQTQHPRSATLPAVSPTERTAHFVYLIACADHTLYTGYTTNVERRLAAHNAGSGARYTRGRRPVTLLAAWRFASKSEALRAERAIKGLPREQKWQIVREGGLDSSLQTMRAPHINDSSRASLGTGEDFP
jgi:putative endonuclease